MATKYTRRVVSLKKFNGAELNTVRSITVEVTASDGTNQYSQNYELDLDVNLDPADFTEYNDLTEEQVIGWFNSYPISDIAEAETELKLANQQADTVETNFPWA